MKTQSLTWPLAILFWSINPIFSGCESASEDEFTFGEAELLDLLDEVNAQTWETTVDGVDMMVSVEFVQVMGEEILETDEQASLWTLPLFTANSASACGTRSFLAEAEACIDMTSLSVEGVLTLSPIESADEPLVFPVSGSLDVFGFNLDNAELWVSSEDISANWRGIQDETGEIVDFELSNLN